MAKKIGYFLDNEKQAHDVADLMHYSKGISWHHYPDTASFFEALSSKIPDVLSIGNTFEQQVTLEDSEQMTAYGVLAKALDIIPHKTLDNGKVSFYFHGNKSSINNALKSYLKGYRDLIVKERSKK